MVRWKRTGKEVNPPRSRRWPRSASTSRRIPKPWTDEIVRAADVVVTMGLRRRCPFFPGKRHEDWTLDDPAGRSVDAVRLIRDEIEQRCATLLTELGSCLSRRSGTGRRAVDSPSSPLALEEGEVVVLPEPSRDTAVTDASTKWTASDRRRRSTCSSLPWKVSGGES